MSGKVRGGAPWMRQALAEFTARYPDALETIEAAIPDGCHVNIFGHSGPRASFGAVLVGPDGELARVPTEHPTLMSAAYAVLHSAREAVAS